MLFKVKVLKPRCRRYKSRQDKYNLFYYLNINQISKITIKNVNQASSMNSKKETQILPEMDP